MTTARTHAWLSRLAVLAIAALIACRSSQRDAVGVMTTASGPVQRAQGDAYVTIPEGTKLYRGDRLRTGTGTASITLADGSRVEVKPQSEVELVERGGMLALEIGRGAIVLAGTGTYALEMGQVSLVSGTVVVTARDERKTAFELVIGRGSLVEQGGQHWELEVGKIVTLEVGQIVLEAPPDAGVLDASAATSDVPSELVVEVDGDGARMRDRRGRWVRLKRGAAKLAAGSKLATDASTTAIVKTRGTSVALAGGTRIAIGDDLAVAVEQGAVSANLGADDDVPLRVPGGQLSRPSMGTADLRIDVGARGDARVVVALGGAKLTGRRAGSDVDLRRGETAIMRATGAVVAGDVAIPDYFDLEIIAGKLAMQTLHDAAGVSAVRFDFAGACTEGGVIEMDRDGSFRLPRVSYGERAANLLVQAGRWNYRLRCAERGALGPAVASGRLAVVRDRGTRPLPKAPPRYVIDADGRNYHLHYQSQIPDVDVRASGQGKSVTLHLATGRTEKSFTSTTGTFRIPSSALREREYKFWVVRDGLKSKVSSLKISFDQTAAQVYIESPVEGRPWHSEIEIRGATLPGWTASVDGVTIPSDRETRRFRTTVPAPAEARAIGIRLEHPEHGVHVYVRRGGGKEERP